MTNYTDTSADYRTNEEIAQVIEEMIRQDVYPVFDLTRAVTPYIAVTRGGRKGNVHLYLSKEEDKPDVIEVSAKMDDNTPDRIIGAILEHAVTRGFLDEREAMRDALTKGFQIKLARNDDGLRYYVTRKRNVPGSALAYEKIHRAILAALSFIGKATKIRVYFADETDKEKSQGAPTAVKIRLNEHFEEDIEALVLAVSPDQLRKLAQIASGVLATITEAQEQEQDA